MMEFVVLTASFTLAILLASVFACMIVMSKPVMKWYMKRTFKITNKIMEDLDENVYDRD